jgi:hypothetical protein
MTTFPPAYTAEQKRERAMSYFHLKRIADADADSYWVHATTPEYARHLIARNVRDAVDAKDLELFSCEPSARQMPSPNFIYRRLSGPVPITKR